MNAWTSSKTRQCTYHQTILYNFHHHIIYSPIHYPLHYQVFTSTQSTSHNQQKSHHQKSSSRFITTKKQSLFHMTPFTNRQQFINHDLQHIIHLSNMIHSLFIILSWIQSIYTKSPISNIQHQTRLPSSYIS